MPVLLLQSQQYDDYTLHNKFNSEFLTIICLPPTNEKMLPPRRRIFTKIIQSNLLQALSKNLLYLRKNRVILRMDFAEQHENLQNIKEIFRYCDLRQILNIIIISYQFPYNDTIYYSYEKFPRFEVIKHNWHPTNREDQKLFPNKIQNLKGHPLRTLPDQIVPRSMVYNDSLGNLKIAGYVGHFVNYFAQGINASLVMPYRVKQGSFIFYSDVIKLTRNNIVDIPASISGPLNNTHWSEFSYPFELVNWCVMLPMEAELSKAKIFLAVLNTYFICNLYCLFICFTFLLIVVFKRIYSSKYRISLADILINDKAFRAVLAQGFPFRYRTLDYFIVYIYFLLFLTGLVVATLYSVYLSSFLTSPPKQKSIKSFADLQKSGTKLLISQKEYNLIYPEAYAQYTKLFHVIDSYEEFLQIRNTLNTTYAYVIVSSRWPEFAGQQKLFSRPLFRYSTDICFTGYTHLYFILPTNSIFRETLHYFILKSYASGLFYHWFQSSFHEMVALGRTSLCDITESQQLRPITIKDLKLIFRGFCFGLIISLGIFVLEVCIGRKCLCDIKQNVV